MMQVGPIGTNCYILEDDKTNKAAVIDPGDEADKIAQVLQKDGAEVEYILLTHGHYDHIGAVDALLEKWPGLPVYIHPADLCPAESTRERYRMPDKGASQRTYGDGDVLELGELRIHVLHTPGHSPGSVVLLVEDVMLAGDTLFAGSCGRWDLPGGDGDALMASLARLGALEGNYKVCPGHGHASLLDREREYNQFMRQAMKQ